MNAVKKASAWLRDPSVRVVFAILVVVVFPAVLTLYTVRVPMPLSDLTKDPTPLGYTVSLLIYLVPVAALHLWFRRKYVEGGGMLRRRGRFLSRRTLTVASDQDSGVDYRRSAFRWTLLTLIPVGFLLDVVFGHAFLTFKNANATFFRDRGLFPAFDFAIFSFRPHIPLEEFVFYTFGFIAILSVYVWCDEYWLKLYNVPDYEMQPRPNGSGLPQKVARVLFLEPFLIAIALVVSAYLYKKLLAHTDHQAGFPSYFTFLVVASFLPSILLFRTTQRFINWQAVSFTVFWVALTSILWEATLAAPYGWWGYQPFHMMGLFVGAWFGLPVEAVILWLSVTFTTVMVYETFKILICMKKHRGVDWRTAMFGRDFRRWVKEELQPATAASDAEDIERALAENEAGIPGNRP